MNSGEHQYDYYYKAEYLNLACDCGQVKAIALSMRTRYLMSAFSSTRFSEFEVRKIERIVQEGKRREKP